MTQRLYANTPSRRYTDTLSGQIKLLARELGFDPVGITRLSSFEEGERALFEWVREGRHGAMRYLEDFEARKRRLLARIPGARSVICLGVNYYQGYEGFQEVTRGSEKLRPENQKNDSAIRIPQSEFVAGRVARYAWGRDYHEGIRERHQTLLAKLKEAAGPDFQAVSCVDIQPLPERFGAVQAGFGFIGKHTGLLNARYGPWLFLSEIITNLDLEPDLPRPGDCGTCDRCQRVCPTGALDQDYRLDARLCISYWTIEHKGILPRAIRPKIKDWIFGCDECLEGCPFTSKQKTTAWPEFQAGAGAGPWLSIPEVFALGSEKAYKEKMRGTPLLRAGWTPMLRNACLVLGNSADPQALPLLRQALIHPASLVRLHAAWGLHRLSPAEARTVLESRLAEEPDHQVRTEIQELLVQRP